MIYLVASSINRTGPGPYKNRILLKADARHEKTGPRYLRILRTKKRLRGTRKEELVRNSPKLKQNKEEKEVKNKSFQ